MAARIHTFINLSSPRREMPDVKSMNNDSQGCKDCATSVMKYKGTVEAIDKMWKSICTKDTGGEDKMVNGLESMWNGHEKRG